MNWLCLTMVIRAGLSSKSLASIAGCFNTKYLSWMNDFHKSSIVSCSLSTSAANSWLAAPFNPSSVMAAVSALFVFLKLLSVLSNSVSAGIRSDPYFLCIIGLPEIKVHSDQ